MMWFYASYFDTYHLWPKEIKEIIGSNYDKLDIINRKKLEISFILPSQSKIEKISVDDDRVILKQLE